MKCIFFRLLGLTWLSVLTPAMAAYAQATANDASNRDSLLPMEPPVAARASDEEPIDHDGVGEAQRQPAAQEPVVAE